ncbi:Proline-specific permease [Vanrija pseudolonga]|uniref:Proline-specific permease n=1 Tax=Vanrija pseudolonga TaxID=143232 RepID=A0AAF1BI17_9TREE|nr:Proline-specific permease [Vanrija pseudolonga]
MTDKDPKRIETKVDVEAAAPSLKDVPIDPDRFFRDSDDSTGTVRGLKARHLQLIAIGAAVGTGLFIGSSRSLIYAGPIGAFVAYALYSAVIWDLCLGVGEMAAFLPVRGGYINWASMYLDPAVSFAIGWNQFYAATMFGCADIVAATGLLGYWWPHINPAVWISIALVIVIALNVYHVKFFGEAEFYFASLKVILILMMIFMAFIVMLGGNPKHDRIGFRYWKKPGVWAEYHSTGALGRFLGFWQVFKIAAFSIGGPDTVAMCSAEAVQPRRSVPRATKSVVLRLAVFFGLGILSMGVLVPYNDPVLLETTSTGVGADASAFVVGMKRVGIRYLPDIFNFMVLTSALSCTNGFAYIATRVLHSLASRGEAPAIFARTTKRGVPIYAFGLVVGILCLSYMQVSTNSAKVFGWFINLSSVAALINNCTLSFMAIRFRTGLKVQGYPSNFLPWSTRFTVPWCYFSFTLSLLIMLTQGWTVFVKGGWNVQEFLSAYFGIALFAVLFTGWKIKHKTKMVKLKDMDFDSRVEEFDKLDEYYRENPPTSTTWWGRLLDKLF